MKIAVVTIVYSSAVCPASTLINALESANEITCQVFLHTSDRDLVRSTENIAKHPGICCYSFKENRGVSRSWNDGILIAQHQGAEAIIVANDDIAFALGDIDKLAETATDNPDRYIITCAGYHLGYREYVPGVGYSCFAINPIALNTLGCFDENIFPAYCEDQDYSRRAFLAGLHEGNCPDTKLSHVGSNSIRSSPALAQQNAVTQRRNHEYWHRKWGGPAEAPVFTHPFNDPQFDCFISPQNRRSPYPGYDRTDQDIVRL